MSKMTTILITGLAMFSMFFGSGNLVFPLSIGMKTGGNFLSAAGGLMITGIMVPFLGLISMILYQGNRTKYFSLLGNWAPFLLTLFLLSLLGPFGVVPRCIIVAFGGFNLLWHKVPLAVFSGVFLLVTLAIIWHKNTLIPILGKWLTPFLVMGVALIIVAALFYAPDLSLNNSQNSFSIGLREGYQTMDLLAAFFFSITIIEHLRKLIKSESEVIKMGLMASIVGAGLLAIVYFAFVALGAYYAPYLVKADPAQYLAIITTVTLGKHALAIATVTIILACLTTAVALVSLFAEFLQQDIAKNKISRTTAIVITLSISFLLSLTGFTALSKFLALILEYLYPALIAFAVCSMVQRLTEIKLVKPTFWLTVAAAWGYKLLAL